MVDIDPAVFGAPDEQPPDEPWPNSDPYDPDPTPASHGDQARIEPGPTREYRGASWAAIDLGPYLRGEHVRPEPSMGIGRTDGLRLLYPGKEHAVIGEMESGKSWLAIACVAAEITRGRRVVYVHFEEADPTDTIERLQALEVRDDEILARFAFAGPSEPVDPAALAVLLDPPPSLVVLDGINEAMSLHRYNPREEDGVALFRARLVKPCTAAGAAVLSADHVVKDRERRDRSPIGSVHKGNGLTGSLILLENVEAFGRGRRGASHVFVTKDRPGYLRLNGRADKLPGKTYMGTLVVDDTREWRDYLDLAFLAPKEEPATEGAQAVGDADEAAVLAAVREITAMGGVANVRKVEATARIGKTRAGDAIERLLLRGRLLEARGLGTLASSPSPRPSQKINFRTMPGRGRDCPPSPSLYSGGTVGRWGRSLDDRPRGTVGDGGGRSCAGPAGHFSH